MLLHNGRGDVSFANIVQQSRHADQKYRPPGKPQRVRDGLRQRNDALSMLACVSIIISCKSMEHDSFRSSLRISPEHDLSPLLLRSRHVSSTYVIRLKDRLCDTI